MATVSDTSRTWTIFRLIGAYLTVLFLWRLFVPAHEYSMRTAQMLDIGLTVLLVVTLIGMRNRLRVADPDDARWGLGRLLFACGLVSGIGMLLIRVTSNAAWWTGHLMYSLD